MSKKLYSQKNQVQNNELNLKKLYLYFTELPFHLDTSSPKDNFFVAKASAQRLPAQYIF